jgi:Flp pilus assembly pilin Flp
MCISLKIKTVSIGADQMTTFLRFLGDKSGSVHVEYSTIALMIGVALIGTFTMIGGWLGSSYGAIATAFTAIH